MSGLVYLATAEGTWELDDDALPLSGALERLGIHARPAVWTDPEVDWSAPDAVVVRSTWDYALRAEEFVAWAERVGSRTRLFNSAEMIAWNTEKTYMRDLAAGLPVVDSFFVDGHDPEAVRSAASRALSGPMGTGEFVVKPTVSAGSKHTGRFNAADMDPACDLAAMIADSGREVMLQPYLPTVDTASETGLVYFNGEFSHAFEKGAILEPHAVGSDYSETGLFALERIGPREPREDQLSLGAAVLEWVEERFAEAPLYARVDILDSAELVSGNDPDPVLLELEITEPSWFLATSPGSADTAARAIRDRLGGA